MTRRVLALAALSALAAVAAAAPAHAALTGPPEVVVDRLVTPWEVARVPDGRLLVTERPGRIRVVAGNGDLCRTPAFTDPTTGITVRKFLGLAVHPGWAQNGFVYLYETYSESGVHRSRILRLVDNGSTLTFDREIFDGIPSDLQHDGGRIDFGPDGKLYVTTGDIHDKALPRDETKLNGKILRLEAPGDDTDGQPVADNPWFGLGGDARYVYSEGHRNPQGLDWDAAGRLWETDHGPSGEGTPERPNGHDELNLVVKGGDYGWPDAIGDDVKPGTIGPVVHSGPAPAWAPGDVAYAGDGSLYVPMLNGQHLRRFVLSGETVISHAPVYSNYGRLRVGMTDGDTFWFAQDGSAADIMRVGIDKALPAFGAADCGALGTGPDPTADTGTTDQAGGGTTPPGTPAGQPLPLGLPQPAPRSAPSAFTAPLDRLLGRVRASLRRRGALARLVRTGRLTVRAGGLAPGRVVLRIKLRRGGRTATVAEGAARPRSRSAFTLRLRVAPRGRGALRRAGAARLVVESTYQPARGARVVRTLSLTARR